MAAVSTTAKPPTPLNLTDRLHQGENWKLFAREWKFYEIAAGISRKPNEVRVASLLNVIGKDGVDMYDMFQWSSESDALKIDKVLEKFAERCFPARNETYERHVFFKREQAQSESLDQYITALMKLSSTCGLGDLRESLVRDRLILGVTDDKVREKLLGKRDLNLDRAIQMIKATQVTRSQANEISGKAVESRDHEEINSLKIKKESAKGMHREELPACIFCGRKHPLERKLCPASGKTCRKCGQRGHFAVKCRSDPETKKAVNHVEQGPDVPEERFFIHNVAGSDQALVSLKLNDTVVVTFQIDTGSTANILPLKEYVSATGDVNGVNILPRNITLVMHDHSQTKAMGLAHMKVEHDNNNHELSFIVVRNNVTPLLGLKASQGMGLVKILEPAVVTVGKALSASEQEHSVHATTPDPINETVEKDPVLRNFADVFQGLGCLPGEYSIWLDETVPPVVHPPRRVPVPKREAMKKELDQMVSDNIIAPVAEPTDWVSSVLIIPKKNGSVRVCLDPKDLNKAIKRSHYPLPTLEDVATRLTNAKIYSVLDAKSGFWHVKLADKSSYYTTFNTPFGRFRWLRMPFGISSAPEVWQRKMNEAVEGLSGVEVIADDFLVCGYGDTIEAAQQNHDKNLQALLERCRKINLVLNPQKILLRASQVPFMGHILTANGVVPDPGKVHAIRDMPPPTDVTSLKKLLGMVTYLSKFLPNLSSACEPLRQLERKDTSWCWLRTHDASFQQIKDLVCKAPILKYYDVNQEVTVESDASLTGLGATLLQAGQLVAFASRALTPAETRYAQIEKELLSVVFACERFDTHLYGRDLVHIKTDHRPLASIFKKALGSAPQRLQRMLLRLQRYNLDVKYQKGSLMVMSDPLSRAYVDSSTPTETEYCHELEDITLVDDLPMSASGLQEFKECTATDNDLQMLMTVVLDGWPDTQAEAPAAVKPYFQCRDEITVQDGLVFKGDRLVVPAVLRKKMMEKAHYSHLGIEGCLRRAREVFYWPRMNADLKDFILTCDICNSHQPEQAQEPLMPHEIPLRPWQKVGTDLFQFEGRHYLITVDYYSSFFEVDRIETLVSTTIISKLKMHFSRHGIPEILIFNNGPQYASAEISTFSKTWDFHHCTSSPHHPQSNGKAESAVKVCKSMMKKAAADRFDPYLALLDLRNTPTAARIVTYTTIVQQTNTHYVTLVKETPGTKSPSSQGNTR